MDHKGEAMITWAIPIAAIAITLWIAWEITRILKQRAKQKRLDAWQRGYTVGFNDGNHHGRIQGWQAGHDQGIRDGAPWTLQPTAPNGRFERL